jgi:hypothetical protein
MRVRTASGLMPKTPVASGTVKRCLDPVRSEFVRRSSPTRASYAPGRNSTLTSASRGCQRGCRWALRINGSAGPPEEVIAVWESIT